MKALYLATMNPHKVEELAAMLAGRLAVRAAGDLDPLLDWDENGVTFEENARIKAMAVRQLLLTRGLKDAWVLADDSGLVVDALGGAPGVHSARYAGPGASAADNNAKLREALAALGPGHHAARFVCVLHWIDAAGREKSYRGVCEGAVTTTMRGAQGFGYDPLFVVEGQGGKTMAELSQDEKNALSHRGRAMAQWLADVR